MRVSCYEKKMGIDASAEFSAGESYIASNDNALWINGNGNTGLFNAVKAFENTVKTKRRGQL